MKALITTLSALAMASTLALAQDKPEGPPPGAPPGGPPPGERGQRQRMDPEKAFKDLDKDANGKVSLDEFKAGPMGKRAPDRAEEIFKRINKDNSEDGISLEEFKAARAGGPGGPGRGRGGRGGGGGAGGDKPAPPPADKPAEQ